MKKLRAELLVGLVLLGFGMLLLVASREVVYKLASATLLFFGATYGIAAGVILLLLGIIRARKPEQP